MTVCDTNYCFTLTDLGAYWSYTDGRVLRESVFGNQLDSGNLNILPTTLLMGTTFLCLYWDFGLYAVLGHAANIC